MNSWIGSGGEVTRGENQRWAMDRQIRLMAGTVALGGVLLAGAGVLCGELVSVGDQNAWLCAPCGRDGSWGSERLSILCLRA